VRPRFARSGGHVAVAGFEFGDPTIKLTVASRFAPSKKPSTISSITE
jgi:hypothetical protein